MNESNALQQAIDFFGEKTSKRGALKRFSDALGVSPMVVKNWLKRRLPAEYVLPVEKVCDFTVSRHALRLDLYPRENCACPRCVAKSKAA